MNSQKGIVPRYLGLRAIAVDWRDFRDLVQAWNATRANHALVEREKQQQQKQKQKATSK